VGRVLHSGVSEEGGDKLGGSVRLVAAGEAAGEKNDLALIGGPDKPFNASLPRPERFWLV